MSHRNRRINKLTDSQASLNALVNPKVTVYGAGMFERTEANGKLCLDVQTLKI